MRLLLDTHLLIWAVGNPERLGRKARAEIESRSNAVLFSAASIWEIAIKAALKRADFAVAPEQVASEALDIGFTELPVRSDAAICVASLALHHRDPFDRILIAQAVTEEIRLYTADEQLASYSKFVHVIERA